MNYASSFYYTISPSYTLSPNYTPSANNTSSPNYTPSANNTPLPNYTPFDNFIHFPMHIFTQLHAHKFVAEFGISGVDRSSMYSDKDHYMNRKKNRNNLKSESIQQITNSNNLKYKSRQKIVNHDRLSRSRRGCNRVQSKRVVSMR